MWISTKRRPEIQSVFIKIKEEVTRLRSGQDLSGGYKKDNMESMVINFDDLKFVILEVN